MSGSKNGGTFTRWVLHSRKKEGAPTLLKSMDGTEELSEISQAIPYDLLYKWNLINKTNK